MNAMIKKAVLAAAIASAPFAASATDLVGGGASLPALAYVGDSFTASNPQARLSSNPFAGLDAGSGYVQAEILGGIFLDYELTGNTASYCQTGSGTGRRVLLGAPGWSASGDCRDYSASPAGFSGLNALPDFAGSDAPLNASDIATFQNGNQATRDNLVQVPALGALIGLPVNVEDNFGNPITNVNLTTKQVCDIFSGDAQVWTDVGVSSSDPITMVVRTDESGTVFATTQYFAANCNVNYSDAFVTSEDFTDSYGPSDYNSSVTASGNGGVVAAVAANSGSIGFANFANVDEAGLAYALIEGHDPATASSVGYAIGDLLPDTVLGDVDLSTGLPTTQTLFSIDPALVEGCLAVINPAAQLEGDYPIAAVTNLLTYTDNNVDPAATRDLFKEVISGSSALPVGFARLASGIQTASENIIDTCIN
ncbi:substrate-binding domain-containing protein [Alloalcanivorax xenomutans]|uniref:PstS family phosphate ABC transporter substrate-binding protein n=1 Tax=Alloalcanivorax xenomutans TaxID=1094342 RepID=UPI002934B11B|nr:substrate-binding domain-containing protein [Alloalcanivorax xenomutans]WOD29348.1 substrate-binding domain-containing protein [Alloalcanivorax xenomutans]